MARAYFRLFYDQYVPLVEGLNETECGRLFVGMMKYAREDIPPRFTGNERFVWPFIKEDIDRDKLAYIRKCMTNAENGRKGGLKKQEDLANANERRGEDAESAQAKEAKEANQAKKANEANQAKEANQANQVNPEADKAHQAVPGRCDPGAGESGKVDFNRRFEEYVRSLITPEDLDYERICAEAARDEARLAGWSRRQ